MALASISSLRLLTPELCAKLRKAFTQLGFTDSAVADAERIAPGQFDPIRLPLVRWRLSQQGTPAAALTAFFLYGDTLTPEALEGHLGAPLAAALREAGLVSQEGAALRSAFRLLPFEGLWLLHDDPAAGPEAVMGPGPTTLELIRWTSGLKGRSVLDLGCGAGTLALVAASRGARRVLGTDVSERAVEVARFNARLNALDVELRAGSLFEPLQGERFEVLLAQPPYVTLPPQLQQVTFLHGGAHGDELALRLLSGLQDALAPLGHALVLFDSAVRKEPLATRVRAAVGNAALDVALLTAKGMSADMQSIAYATVSAVGFGPEYEAAVRRYREHLESLGVTEFSHALFAGRRVDGPEARFAVGLPVRSLSNPAPGALDALFTALELASGPDEALLRAAVSPREGLSWVEERKKPDSSLQPRFKVVSPPGAIASDQELAEASYVLLGVLEDKATVAAAVDAYAHVCSASPKDVRPQVLSFVRQGLATGLLAPR